jgi:lipopolysaccharide biosynthesis glycosyltransferase
MSHITIHVALCANERYFPGLFCAIGSALRSLGLGYRLQIHLIDAGIAESSKQRLEQLVTEYGDHSIHWLPAPESRLRGVFGKAHHRTTYYRLALPEILELDQIIYLDADVLVFGCLGKLWEAGLASDLPVLAVQDWETLNFADDTKEIATTCGDSKSGGYFNAGILVMNLDCLRRESFTNLVCAMLTDHGELVRFADQTALNWHCSGRWKSLEKTWNYPAWVFDAQNGNDLPMICHYTNHAPWLKRLYSPSQALFERVAFELDFVLPKAEHGLGHAAWRALLQWVLAPVRMAYQLARFVRLKQGDDPQGSSASATLARYWWDYLVGGPGRVIRYRRRIREIRSDSFSPFPRSSS